MDVGRPCADGPGVDAVPPTVSPSASPPPDAAGARLRGVLAPVLTPFARDLSPSVPRLLRHCRWLLARGVGLAVFGTNSEANSLGLDEKCRLLDQLAEHGVPMDRLMPGTGACALPEAIALTRHAVQAGCAGVLMLPPFYYKGVSEEGLYRSFSTVIDAVADPRLRLYLHHIPAVSQVPVTHGLIERLLRAWPLSVAGIKDSSGDWSHTRGLLERFQPQGFDVFAGTEALLLPTLRACVTRDPGRGGRPAGPRSAVLELAVLRQAGR